MADYNGVNKTLYDSASIIGEGIDGGDLKVKEFEYEADGISVAKTIAIATPFVAGDRILEIVMFSDALGGSSTLDIGDGDDDDRYDTAIATSSAARTVADNIGGANYAIGTNDDDEQLILTVGGAAITGTIKGIIKYTNN